MSICFNGRILSGLCYAGALLQAACTGDQLISIDPNTPTIDIPELAFGIAYVVPSVGQSRESGGQIAGGTSDNPPISINPVANAGGLAAFGNNEASPFNGPFLPLTVNDLQRFNNSGQGRGEFPALAVASSLSNRFSAAQSNFDVVVFNTAVDGSSIAEISKGTAIYQSMVDRVAISAQAANRIDTDVLGLSFTQGIGDSLTSDADYEASMIQYSNDVNADLRAITGQTRDIALFISQLTGTANGHRDKGLVQLALSKSNPSRFIISNPIYMMNFYDAQHYDNQSSHITGLYKARAMYQTIFEGVPFVPNQSISTAQGGGFVDIVYNREGLEFDTSLYPNQGDYGFVAINASGIEPITNIEIVSTNMTDDTVRIHTDNPLTEVRYAQTRVSGRSDAFNGFAGNLRDSSAFTTFNGFPLNDWAVPEDIAL